MLCNHVIPCAKALHTGEVRKALISKVRGGMAGRVLRDHWVHG